MNIGIDLGGSNIRIGVINHSEILKKESIPCPSHDTAEHVLQQLISLIGKHINNDIQGIGIGVPSVVDTQQGIVYNVANIPAWKEVHLKEELEKAFSIPVFINNDSNCFALGEQKFGKGKDYANIIGLTIGTGIGAGVIVNRQLYSGRNAGAGEVGSLPYLQHDFEHYCSSHFFTTYHQITGQEAALRAIAGDENMITIWNDFGKHIGEMVKAILYTYDPEAIIIGGGIASSFAFFKESMWNNVCNFPYPETLKHIHIIVSENKDIALLGASALIEE